MKVGLLTIGQSPRKDVTNDLKGVLDGISIVEEGALDDLSIDDIKSKFSPEPGYTTYVSRLRDGIEVKISKEKIVPLLQRKIDSLGKEADLIALLCSGEFPMFKSKVPIIFPDRLLKHFISAVFTFEYKLGVFIPLEEQVPYAIEKWGQYTRNLKVVDASPYKVSDQGLKKKAEKLSDRDLIIMDCIGYTFRQKRTVIEVLRKPVLTARGLLAVTLKELLF